MVMEQEGRVRLVEKNNLSDSSSHTTANEESTSESSEGNGMSQQLKGSQRSVSKPARQPTLLSGPVTISPTNFKDSIVGRQDVGPGQLRYIVSHRSGDSMFENLIISPQDILEHVSAAELEEFESREARDERRQAIETRRTKREEEAQSRASELVRNRFRKSVMARRSVTPSSNDEVAPATSLGKRLAQPVAAKRKSKIKKPEQARSKGRSQPQNPSDEEEFEVEAIVNHAEIRGKRSFLVKWVGYPSEENSWLPERDLTQTAAELVQEYLQRKRERYEIDQLAEHHYESDGGLFFRVQWKGFPGEDTWEPAKELPKKMVKEFWSSKSSKPGLEEEQSETYEIDRIVEDHYDSDGELFFKVQWKGYPNEDTWEAESRLPFAMIQEFLSSKSLLSAFTQKNHSRSPFG